MQLGNGETRIEALTINGTTVRDANVMANEFNSYFTNIAHSLAEKIPPTPLDSLDGYLQTPSLSSMGLLSTSSLEILDIGRDIKLTHSKGIDDIDPCVAASSLCIVASPLAEIINSSL